MSSVEVTFPIGSKTYARAEADVFAKDTLSISTLDGKPWEEFDPLHWLSATAYDEQGNVRYSFLNSQSAQALERAQQAARLVRASLEERHAVHAR